MSTQYPEAASAFMHAMQDAARSLGDVEYNVAGRGLSLVKLRCRYVPNLSYGRYNAPTPGCEQFEYEWAVWTRQQADDAPAHQVHDRGWYGVGAHEALQLLEGNEWPAVKAALQAKGKELADRFSGAPR